MSYQLNEVKKLLQFIFYVIVSHCGLSIFFENYLIVSRFDDVNCHVAYADDIYNLIIFNNNFFGAVFVEEKKILRVINESTRRQR